MQNRKYQRDEIKQKQKQAVTPRCSPQWVILCTPVHRPLNRAIRGKSRGAWSLVDTQKGAGLISR